MTNFQDRKLFEGRSPKRALSPKGLVFSIFILSHVLLSQAHAWGPISHRMLTETAALLIEKSQPNGWGPLLAKHRFELGYYSLVPDSVYRHKDGSNGALEAPTHYYDLDILFGSLDLSKEFDQKINSIPQSYSAALKYFEKKIGKEKALAAGSAPWRVDQFLSMAREELKNLKEIRGTYQPGKSATGNIRKIFLGLYYLGVMSHYSGDSTMPYHVTSDWNGYGTGQGGIHFYFEFDCVNALDPDLSTTVLNEAVLRQKEWRKSWNTSKNNSVISLMFEIFRDSVAVLPKLIQIDKDHAVLKASPIGVRENAVRKKPANVCGMFRPLLVEQLAKAAVLTAYLWEMALPAHVNFSNGESLQFSDIDGDPQYIGPNYLAQ